MSFKIGVIVDSFKLELKLELSICTARELRD